MKKNKFLINSLFLVCAVILAILPSACGLDWGQSSKISGDVLNLYGEDPYTLDPALAGDSTSINYILQIFSGLVTFNDDLEPVADIAESWEVSDDNLVYTFYLRNDACFHDGKKVKAVDFKYSWERACNPLTGSQTASLYLGDILGTDEVLAGETVNISGVRVIDNYTLKVTLKSPVTYFLEKLSYPVSFVVDEKDISGSQYWWINPNGTGPFKLWRWEEGSELVLQSSDKYYRYIAKLDYVVYKILSGIEFDMYETGEIDVCSVGLANIYRATDIDGEFYNQLYSNPELSLMYMCFNCNQPPFDDVNIRRAFAMSIDKTKLVSLIYNNTVMRADGIIPFGMYGYNENLSVLSFDTQAALALIAESSYGDISNLPEIVITSGGYGGQISTIVDAVINEWRVNLGIEVTVRQLEPNEFLYNILAEKDNLFFWGWSADYPHPQNFLEILFSTDSEGNYGGYSNVEADMLLKLAAIEQDEEVSLELYRQAEQIFIDDAACIPLYFGRNYILVKPYVKGYELNALGMVNLNEVYLVN
ncbi:MAG: peptide ABC transporter substrate-binding protein [Dehalococcoidales bacterium]|nr:peptide ABC transporter substrate-binding protein [Dehalococcoidales bacterium]